MSLEQHTDSFCPDIEAGTQEFSCEAHLCTQTRVVRFVGSSSVHVSQQTA